MNASDLETYEYQLSQIKLALAKDPNNSEYLNLKQELQSLIDLTKEYLQAAGESSTSTSTSTSNAAATTPSSTTTKTTTAKANDSSAPIANKNKSSKSTSSSTPEPSTSASTSTKKSFKAGDECLARYSGDNKFYPARITTIAGSEEHQVFSIVFKGYQSTEIVSLKDLKPLSSTSSGSGGNHDSSSSTAGKREFVNGGGASEEDMEKEKKRKKYEKKAETQAVKTQEQVSKQKSWQQFAKKGTKKGIVIPGVQGGSMFKSPEDLNPQAKVGVVNSGRGMTKSQERKKTNF